jgi:cytidylate kinase
MAESYPPIITISRQMGSGGAYVGSQVASRLGYAYLDREIISQAARLLYTPEELLTGREETTPSFWQRLLNLGSHISRDSYEPLPQTYLPTEKEIFLAEAEVIRKLASERPAVIIGRCAGNVLGDRPNVLKIFLHARKEFRAQRISETNHISLAAATRLITDNDSSRAAYHRTFGKVEWNDATQYDLTFRTDKIGLDQTVDMILDYLGSAGPGNTSSK